MDVSIVVTVLNEESAVDELYRRVAASLDGSEWEAIFVDDGSTDGTYGRLRALHEQDPRVRVVRFKRNFGQHPAMHAGLARARGARIVTMDGDLQNEPEDIPKLLAALERVDVASGRRVARHDSVGRTMPSTNTIPVPANSGPGKLPSSTQKTTPYTPRASAAVVQTAPRPTPIHCTGCGQNPATTCSASRTSRNGE
jgi:glycosyltransferase involved in cell wall biosynthesis